MSGRDELAARARYARARNRDSDMRPDPKLRRPKKAQVVGGADRWSWECPCSAYPHWEQFSTKEAAQADLDRHLYFGVMHKSGGMYHTRSYK